MNEAVEQFLSQFLKPPKGESPLTERASHLLAVTPSPKQFYPQATEFELRHRRNQARRNLRRLLIRHPELLSMLRAEVSR